MKKRILVTLSCVGRPHVEVHRTDDAGSRFKGIHAHNVNAQVLAVASYRSAAERIEAYAELIDGLEGSEKTWRSDLEDYGSLDSAVLHKIVESVLGEAAMAAGAKFETARREKAA